MQRRQRRARQAVLIREASDFARVVGANEKTDRFPDAAGVASEAGGVDHARRLAVLLAARHLSLGLGELNSDVTAIWFGDPDGRFPPSRADGSARVHDLM